MLHEGRLRAPILRAILVEREDHEQARLLDDGKTWEVVLRRLADQPELAEDAHPDLLLTVEEALLEVVDEGLADAGPQVVVAELYDADGQGSLIWERPTGFPRDTAPAAARS